ncbi:hypothetical protein C5D44_10595 [Rathayibacter sp. AY1B5]|nr:hypothetical protein C5D44_10595 [Rathayibacter sp. AY1B5]
MSSSAYGATAPTPLAEAPVAATTASATPVPERTASPARTTLPTPTPTPTPTVVVTTTTVTETSPVPRGSRSEDDLAADLGVVSVVPGADGVLTRTVEVVQHDGVEVSRSTVSETMTTAPIDDVTRTGVRVPPPAPAPEPEVEEAAGCDPNYSGACVPIDSDVDCAGGSGNGPSYVSGPVTVIGSDVYDLDRDGDGIACD